MEGSGESSLKAWDNVLERGAVTGKQVRLNVLKLHGVVGPPHHHIITGHDASHEHSSLNPVTIVQSNPHAFHLYNHNTSFSLFRFKICTHGKRYSRNKRTHVVLIVWREIYSLA